MKKLLTYFLAIALLFILIIPTFAVSQPTVVHPPLDKSVMRAEQTEWYYRVYNGRLQKRLWSLTYGKWLTDWIDVA